jgi:S1-C subfamily serine protease
LGGLFSAFGAPARSASSRVDEAAERVRTKVVVLKTARTRTAGAANGFLVRPGLVLTAGHVLAEGTSVTAWLNGVYYETRPAARNVEDDLALLELRGAGLALKPVTLGVRSAALPGGEELLVLSSPPRAPGPASDPLNRTLIPTVLQDRVMLRSPEGSLGLRLKLRGSVERGDSGSPIVRVKDGTVVGMLSSRELPDASGVSQFAYAVPLDIIQPWLDQVAKPEEEFYLDRLAR